jgi:hypothetical protein
MTKTIAARAALTSAVLGMGLLTNSLAIAQNASRAAAQTTESFVATTPENADACRTASVDGGEVTYRKGIQEKGLKRVASPRDASSGLATGRRISLCTSAQSAVDRINASSEESRAMVDALSRNDTATMRTILVRNGLSLDDADTAQRGTHFKSVTIKRGSNACDGAVCEADPSSGSSASRFKITLTIKLSKPAEISVSFEK